MAQIQFLVIDQRCRPSTIARGRYQFFLLTILISDVTRLQPRAGSFRLSFLVLILEQTEPAEFGIFNNDVISKGQSSNG